MGYRERKAHRNQQKQQSLGQSYQAGQLINVPAPKTMNMRDNPLEMGSDNALLLENAFFVDGGVECFKAPISTGIYLASTSGQTTVGPFITYYGSGSASAEFWCVANSRINRLTDNIQFAQGTATATTTPSFSYHGDYTEFRRTIIYVSQNIANYWTRASGWNSWTPSVSASVSAKNFIGVTNFKNRLYAWPDKSDTFYYGSVDQVQGTLNPFDLGAVLPGSIRMVVTLPRDGGAGPDDYIAFISDQGHVVVYSGSNPGDASDWSLVGVYKIGRPISRDSHITYGNQVVIMCEDDFYFLPEDMVQKRRRTLGTDRRKADNFTGVVNAVYDSKKSKLIFSDGSVLDPHRDYTFSTLKLMSADPAMLRRHNNNFWRYNAAVGHRPIVGEFKGNSYVLAIQDHFDSAKSSTGDTSQGNLLVRGIFPTKANGSSEVGIFPTKIRTAPIPTTGRTDISMVSPIFGSRTRYSAPINSAATTIVPTPYVYEDPFPNMRYALGIEYDAYNRPLVSVSAPMFTMSTSAEGIRNTEGHWIPTPGTGSYAQLYMEVTQASANQDIIFYGFKAVISDTGGI